MQYVDLLDDYLVHGAVVRINNREKEWTVDRVTTDVIVCTDGDGGRLRIDHAADPPTYRTREPASDAPPSGSLTELSLVSPPPGRYLRLYLSYRMAPYLDILLSDRVRRAIGFFGRLGVGASILGGYLSLSLLAGIMLIVSFFVPSSQSSELTLVVLGLLCVAIVAAGLVAYDAALLLVGRKATLDPDLGRGVYLVGAAVPLGLLIGGRAELVTVLAERLPLVETARPGADSLRFELLHLLGTPILILLRLGLVLVERRIGRLPGRYGVVVLTFWLALVIVSRTFGPVGYATPYAWTMPLSAALAFELGRAYLRA